jgi:hypothetical protein
MCRDVDYASIFARFIERREAILGVVRDFAHLDEDRREDIVEYWEAFFEMAADPRRQERILRDCTAIPS